MTFTPKEKVPGLSGGDRIPAWSRVKMIVENIGFEDYLGEIVRIAKIMQNEGDTNKWEEPTIINVNGKDDDDPTFTMYINQKIKIVSSKGQSPYRSVRIEFHWDVSGHPTMEIWGDEQTYNGVLPKSFHDESPDIQPVKNGLMRAMLKPKVVSPNAEV